VQVWAGGRTYTRFEDGKSGYLAQSSIPLYFGLDRARMVERIEVTWPSGQVQIQTEGIPMNALVTITEKQD
jgi:hypothetical protein